MNQTAIKTIELLTQALSTPEIDTALLKEQRASLQQADEQASGFFSFKGRYREIIDETITAVKEKEDDHGLGAKL